MATESVNKIKKKTSITELMRTAVIGGALTGGVGRSNADYDRRIQRGGQVTIAEPDAVAFAAQTQDDPRLAAGAHYQQVQAIFQSASCNAQQIGMLAMATDAEGMAGNPALRAVLNTTHRHPLVPRPRG